MTPSEVPVSLREARVLLAQVENAAAHVRELRERSAESLGAAKEMYEDAERWRRFTDDSAIRRSVGVSSELAWKQVEWARQIDKDMAKWAAAAESAAGIARTCIESIEEALEASDEACATSEMDRLVSYVEHASRTLSSAEYSWKECVRVTGDACTFAEDAVAIARGEPSPIMVRAEAIRAKYAKGQG